MPKIKVKGPIVSNSVKWIYDLFDIEATSPSDIERGLDQSEGGDVELEINSGGGSVFDASEMYTALRNHKGKVTANVVGLAASAASVIAVSADKLSMSPTAHMMIHNASTVQVGNRNDMQHTKDMLTNVDQSIANAYQQKSGMDDQELMDMMDKETWLTPFQALEHGLIDEVMFQNDDPAAVASAVDDEMLPQAVIDKVRNMKHTFYPDDSAPDNGTNDGRDDGKEAAQAKLNLLKMRRDDS